MGEIYKIVAPPDPAIMRRKWLWLIAGCVLVLAICSAIYGPGLYRNARLNMEGPGNGPVLVKRADGKIELRVPPAQVLIGKPNTWRDLRAIDTESIANTYIGDFDGDRNQELLVWQDNSPALLYKPDGTVTKPGLQAGRGLLAEVYDWNSDGIDELAVPVNRVPLASWPKHRVPDEYEDFVGRILLTATGKVVGTSNYVPAIGVPIIGSFTETNTPQVIYNSYSYSGKSESHSNYAAEVRLYQELLAHPKYFVRDSNDKDIGSFEGVGYFSWDCRVTDLDGDQLDEVLTLHKDGALWRCKYQAAPLKLPGWPNLTRPVAAGDIDGRAGDELISVRPDPKLSGYEIARSLIRDEDNPLASNDEEPLVKAYDKLQEDADERIKARLAEVGVQPRPWEDDSLPIESRIALRNDDIDEGYHAKLILPTNLLIIKPLLAWECKRPVGFIYSPITHKSQRLHFPGCLKWSNAWSESEMFGDNCVVTSKRDGERSGMVYCIPSVGTGLLGFNAHGKCIYYEEFGTGVSNLYKLKTKDGDYLVLRVGNELLIYP